MQDFWKRIMKSPLLVWKLSAGLLFAILGLLLLIAPGVLMDNIAKSNLANIRILAALLLVYGTYRLVTFYFDLKSRREDDE